MNSFARGFVVLLLVLCARHAAAQSAAFPTRAYAFGWSPAAGLLGVEWVDRSFSAAPRLGGAVGIGIGGVGARLNLTLRDPTTHRRIPYLAAGYAATPWLPAVKLSGVASIEAGVQLWPAPDQRLYADFGAGVGFLVGASSNLGPVLRLLVGRTF